MGRRLHGTVTTAPAGSRPRAPRTAAGRPILIAGIPRSGSSWVGETLAAAPNVSYLSEPDNEKNHLLAYALKRGLHRYPYLPPAADAADYRLLWRLVFEGRAGPAERRLSPARRALLVHDARLEREVGRRCGLVHTSYFDYTQRAGGLLPRARELGRRGVLRPLVRASRPLLARTPADPRRMVAKSVHCALALPWIDHAFAPQVVVLLRHPMSVISSTLRLRMPDAVRNLPIPADDALPAIPDRLAGVPLSVEQRMAAQVGQLYGFLARSIAQHPHWIVRSHEELCLDPAASFRELFDALELEWTPAVAAAIEASDAPGENFATSRVSREEPDKWKRLLDGRQVGEIREVLAAYQLPWWPDLAITQPRRPDRERAR